jgi:hypothetical protein
MRPLPGWFSTTRKALKTMADERIPDVVYRPLSNTYTDEGCQIWWKARNRILHGMSPREAWADPSLQERVMEAIDMLEMHG